TLDVRARLGDEVESGRRDPAGGGRGPLQLGDDVEARPEERRGERARRRRRGECLVGVERGQLVLEVGTPPRRDLLDDVARSPTWRRTRTLGDGHAGAPVDVSATSFAGV